MKLLLAIPLLLLIATKGCTQSSGGPATSPQKTMVGGPCEGCEAIHESPVAFEKMENMVWLPDWNDKGPKLAVNGVVYKADGKTPAPNVILYIYHTDQTGRYPTKGDEKGWAKRHGYLRGWMRTNEKGEYKFFTLRPAPYPGAKIPAHIHIIVKEPGINEYYIDDYLFDNDPYLTPEERKKQPKRGGNGILTFKEGGSMVKSQRDIYLGQHIPDYPATIKK
jgi:protocatechuate 3,4-dioxygenase, beta subunit